MDKPGDVISDNIEVVPVVVLSQTFPARPSSIPDVRDFVKRCLAQSPLTEEDNRSVGETVASALLEAAGPSGAINVSFRIFPGPGQRRGDGVRRLDVRRPAPRGHDHGDRRQAARRVGQDGQPLGRRHHRASPA